MFSHLSRFNLFLIFVTIIALRLVVGFHFYKEGVTKLQDGFDAQYFLKGAKGPLKDVFLSMTDDANGRMQLGITQTLDKAGKTDYFIDNERNYAVWDDFVEQATNYYGFGSPELIAEIEKEIADWEKKSQGDDDSAMRAQEYVADLESQIEKIAEQPIRVANALQAHQEELEDWTMGNRVPVLAWYRGIDRVGLTGERRVQAHHASPTGGQESLVLGQTGLRTGWPVAVGDPVGADHPHANFRARIGDHAQAALDRVR